MRAILRKQFGGRDVLEFREIPEPESKAGHAVIQVKAFGINHAEMHMRKGEWAEIADVSGIECVGVVKSCPGGEFAVGTKVAALMGGLGRTINGSYAEYTRASVTNVAAIESGLSWAELAAIPETYDTAWTCLFRNLEITRGETLVVRGATSSFGQAAINMAVNAGVRVIGTTRSRDQFPIPEAPVAVRVEVEGPDLFQRIAEAKKLDAVLDLVGNSTILDSLNMLRRSGRACLAGWLGGLAPIADLNPLLQKACGVYLTSGGSIVNISSVAATSAPPSASVYSGTKAAVVAITKSLAQELGPRKIRVNAVSPGMVETEGWHASGIAESNFRKTTEAETPLGRIGQPNDIAPAVLFLASADSGWTTGETLYISGGMR